MALTYRGSGVDIKAGDEFVSRIKPLAATTKRPELVSGIGGFSGIIRIPERYDNPVLVSSTDGVGTKLRIAIEMGVHNTVGLDLVAMCVNDIGVCGAEPLYFLDYFASGKLDADVGESIVSGIAEGCRQANCALLGGETAEMPGFYSGDDYELAGFAVGVCEADRIIDGSGIKPGDIVLGLPSSGLHANGFSLVRKALLETKGYSLTETPPGFDRPLGRVLLAPTRIYTPQLLAIIERLPVLGIAHITGGGLPGNCVRILPEGASMKLDSSRWPRPGIFDLIREAGNIETEEMYRVFNMGIGIVLVISQDHVGQVEKTLRVMTITEYVIGEIVEGDREVIIK